MTNAGRPDAAQRRAAGATAARSRCWCRKSAGDAGHPTGREPIDDWKPDATVGGDIFADELSFSPEGKWMAVAHLGIHLGEGERIIEIHGATSPLPAAADEICDG